MALNMPMEHDIIYIFHTWIMCLKCSLQAVKGLALVLHEEKYDVGVNSGYAYLKCLFDVWLQLQCPVATYDFEASS